MGEILIILAALPPLQVLIESGYFESFEKFAS